jgi:hypothetical protein
MNKFSTTAFLIACVFTILIIGFQSRNRFSLAQEVHRLSETELTKTALARASELGLVGEPSQTFTRFIQTNEWQETMFSTGLHTPELPLFILSVKGEIDLTALPYFSVEEPADEDVEAMTIVLDATTGAHLLLLLRYVDDPIGETTDEDRQAYQALMSIDFKQKILESLPPSSDSILLPPGAESRSEVVPQNTQ